MATNLVKEDDNKVKVTVTVEGEPWKKAQQKALRKITSSMDLKGFRKGHVPAALARKAAGEDYVLYKSLQEVLDETLDEIIKEHDLKLADTPAFDYENATPQSVDVTFTLTLVPEVTLGEYKGLNIEKDNVDITDQDVEDRIHQLRAPDADWNVVEDDTPAKKGDEVTINFEGYMNGEKFDGGSAEDQTLTLGSGTFIPGFEDQIVGMKTGEEKDITVTFPEDYTVASLAGQPAIFKTKVTEIMQEDLPELTDKAAAELEFHDAQTVEELKAAVREQLVKDAENRAENNYRNEVLEKVVENATVNIPSAMIDREVNQMFQEFAQRMRAQGFEAKDYLEAIGSTKEEFTEPMRPQAEKQVKTDLVLNAVAKENNLTIGDEEVDSEIEVMAQSYGMPTEQLARMINKELVRDDMIRSKAMDFIMDNQ